jgi:hypothetical protein
MITKPTTLILGAGASKPFGFPTGAELRERIIRITYPEPSEEWNPLTKYFDYEINKVSKFGEAFYYSQQQSIDAFLEHRNEFITIGKLAITLVLLPFEEERELFKNGNWYQYLFNRMTTKTFDDFSQNNINFVTFNYDRSLEYFLLTALSSTYDKDVITTEDMLSKFMPLHIYGSFGNLIGQNSVDYSSNPDRFNTKRASDNILIVSEKDHRATVFLTASQILINTERLYFLGFGYNEINLERLNINNINPPRKIGTAYGLGRSEKDSISSKWHISLFDDHNDVLDFLKTMQSLIDTKYGFLIY